MVAEDISKALGAVDDVWVLIVLIIPGFITFKIITRLGAYEIQLDQFIVTVYSLLCSIIIFVPISYLFNIQSLPDLSLHLTVPFFIPSILGFAVLFGVIPGLFLRFTFRRKFRIQNAWSGFAGEYLGKYILIYTTDEKEYSGWLKRVSAGENEKKELCLGNPRLIKRDKPGEKRFISMGIELYFPEENIKRILRAESG
jgi:hypothetical protein